MMSTTVSREADRWYQNHNSDSVDTAYHELLADVYLDPSLDSLAIGQLMTVAQWHPYLHFSWMYQPSESLRLVVWREDVGDWGYGINQFVIDTTDGFVRLPPGPYGDIAWVPLASTDSTGGLSGEVWSVVGHLIEVADVETTKSGSAEPVRFSGVVFVIEIDSGVVTYRPEVSADMLCGETVSGPDAGEVPRYQSPLSAFLTKDLQPKFQIAYPKGC